MEFFRTNTESSDRALDVWKNFLWEWTTERALPFETSHKHKYIPVNWADEIYLARCRHPLI